MTFMDLVPWRVRSFLRRTWKRARHRGGDFQHGESSDRASRMSLFWEQNWTGVEPVGNQLRSFYPDRWVRFHSLPESKRYADTEMEREEVLLRHRTLLAELLNGAATETLVIIAQDWPLNDLFSGWTKKLLPGCWPWKSYLDAEEDDGDTIASYFWVAPALGDSALDSLRGEVAQDQADIVITDAEMAWLYHPYDGGADVILPTTAARDQLSTCHASWLPAHSLGL
jgi:hypothetical protein